MSRNIAVSLVGAVLSLALAGCEGQLARHSHKVRDGMTLREVQAILGPGEEIPPNQVRAYPDKQMTDGEGMKRVVEGDMFYFWQDGQDEFYVGLRNNKVVGKYLWVPPPS